MDSTRISTEVYRQIKKTIDFLSQRIQLEKVILFGSQITKQSHSESDIDLAVISDDFEQMSRSEFIDLIWRVHQHCSTRVEIHPYSKKHLQHVRSTNFLGHILSHGRVVS